MGQRATLAGIPLLAQGPIGWRFRHGTAPNVQRFEVDNASAQKLLDIGIAGEPVSLVIEDTVGETLQVDRLFILGLAESSAPHLSTVEVADIRWKWPRNHVLRRYNVRRRTGDRRRVGENIIRDPIVDEVHFLAASLQDEIDPWEGRDVLLDVILQVTGGEPPDFRLTKLPSEETIEDLEIDDPGDVAISKVLKFLPGTGLWVDAKGKIVIYDQLSGGEGPVIADMGPEFIGGGHIFFNTNEITRPSEVHILFTREIELRFDSSEETLTRTGRNMENVLPIVDPQLDVTIDGKSRTAVHGTWVPFVDDGVLDRWTPPPAQPPISKKLIRENFFWDEMVKSYVTTAEKLVFNADWARRVSAILANFRQTYRINKFWMDRILRMVPERVAIVDFPTGTRAPSPVFQDHCIVPNTRGKHARPTESLGRNVSGLPNGNTLALNPVSPAFLRVIDAQQGIVRVQFMEAPYRLTAKILPSLMNGIPGAKPGDRWDSKRVALKEEFESSIIVSCIPAFPNDERQLHRVVRKVEDAQQILKTVLGDKPGKGPVMEVRVPPNVSVARFAWSDKPEDVLAIEGAFGVESLATDATKMDKLILNQDEVKAVADAYAAAVYLGFHDREEGRRTDRLRPGVKIDGSVDTISHSLSREGMATTEVSLRGALPVPNLYALLPDAVRKQVQRLVNR